jgi:predicted HD phosphohydrolase
MEEGKPKMMHIEEFVTRLAHKAMRGTAPLSPTCRRADALSFGPTTANHQSLQGIFHMQPFATGGKYECPEFDANASLANQNSVGLFSLLTS